MSNAPEGVNLIVVKLVWLGLPTVPAPISLIKEEYFSKRYFYLENPKKENKKDSEAFLFL